MCKCVHAGVCKFYFWVVLHVTGSVVTTTTTCCCLSHGHVSNLLYVNVIIFVLFKLVIFCVPFTFAVELYHKKYYLLSCELIPEKVFVHMPQKHTCKV